MATLLIKSDGLPEREIQLRSGVNRIGRTAENDFQIDDESISSAHCEMIVGDDGQVFVRDLGSSNGTFLNRELITESYFRLGERLHLGGVEIIYAAESDALPAPAKTLRVLKVQSNSTDSVSSGNLPSNMATLGLRVSTVEPAKISPRNAPPLRQFPSTYATKTFFQRLPSAFSYPFKGNGIVLLICGTIFFVVLDFVGKFSVWLAIVGFGYLFLYMQHIVQHSAQGEEDMPGWPEISNWWDDIFFPAFLLAMTFTVSFGPAVAMWIFLDVDPAIKWTLGISLALFGCCYLPMALLAVSMYDSIFALNPLLIIPSMLRIPFEYLIVCLMLGVVLGIRLISLLVLDLIGIPIVPTVIGGLFSLYFLAVEMRIIGVMYHAKREELNWSF